jgi:hypothetical protein
MVDKTPQQLSRKQTLGVKVGASERLRIPTPLVIFTSRPNVPLNYKIDLYPPHNFPYITNLI